VIFMSFLGRSFIVSCSSIFFRVWVPSITWLQSSIDRDIKELMYTCLCF
jgi:hypothetical protein